MIERWRESSIIVQQKTRKRNPWINKIKCTDVTLIVINLYHLPFDLSQSEFTHLKRRRLRCTSVITWKRQQRGRGRVSLILWYSNVFLGSPLNSAQPLSFTCRLKKASHQLAVWYCGKSVGQKLSGSEHVGVPTGTHQKKQTKKKVLVDICACFSSRGKPRWNWVRGTQKNMMNIHVQLLLLTAPTSPESYMIINQERCVWFILIIKVNYYVHEWHISALQTPLQINSACDGGGGVGWLSSFCRVLITCLSLCGYQCQSVRTEISQIL